MKSKKRVVEFEIDGEEVLSKVKEKVDEHKNHRQEKWAKRHQKGTQEYVMDIIINLFLLYIINHLLSWHVSFLTPNFSQVVPVINVLLVAHIIANAIFISYPRRWFRSLIQLFLLYLSLYLMQVVTTIFPFLIASTLVPLVKFIFTLGMIAIVIAGIIEFVRFIASTFKYLLLHQD